VKRFSDFKIQKIEKLNEQEIVQNEPEVQIEKSEVAIFFSKLFEVRQVSHIFHLQVQGDMGSGWQHEALGEFYNEILEFTDDLIETYQGQYGIVEGYEIIDSSITSETKSLDYLKENVEFIKKERKAISTEDTHLHNIVDEIIALFYKTIYKLTYLK
jgi:hypothetical protein